MAAHKTLLKILAPSIVLFSLCSATSWWAIAIILNSKSCWIQVPFLHLILKPCRRSFPQMLFSHFGLFELSFSVFVFTLILQTKRRRNKLPLPPGPRGLPIVGNAFDIPLVRMPQTYFEWTKKYGTLIFLVELSLLGGG